jgi:ADP-dependent NAD(P)H-hydrate dehydratase / NAD(P)H-hydrate epimerase
MKILTAEQMREIDRLTTERYGIPGIDLMENAANRVVEAIESRFGPLVHKCALIVCGKGNNGGDGAAVARLLRNRHVDVDLVLLGHVEQTRADARTNFDAASRIAGSLAAHGQPPAIDVPSPSGLGEETGAVPQKKPLASHFRLYEIDSAEHLRSAVLERPHDVVIDAIFGTGLSRPAQGLYQEAIDLVNQLAESTPVVSIDIPSGVAADSAQPIGRSVHARMTVTFTAPKIANVVPPVCELNGELIIASIGSPDVLVAKSDSRLSLVDARTVELWLASSRRSPHANKGDVGKVLVIAGSRGKTGAACLVGESALRSGCGLVTIATPASCQPIVAARAIPECMTEPLTETPLGAVDTSAAGRALDLCSERDAAAIGPGLGSSEQSTRSFVKSIVAARTCPMVLDADALNSLAPWPDDLRGEAARPLILTPHPGEMARLIARPISEVVNDRLDLARRFATGHGLILVLKGSRTLIASPDGEVFVNPTGNAGMATGGTGDVLTGLIAGLLAQKLDDPLGSSIAAVYLHGLAGDLAAARTGLRAMLASDIIDNLGDAFFRIGGALERHGPPS